MSKYRSNKSGKSNKVLIGILFLLVAVLAVGMVTALFRIDSQIQTKTLTSIDYEVGTLAEDTGLEDDFTGSIRSKDSYNVEGLTIKVKDESKISYKLFFFDEEGKFLSVAEDTSSIPETASTFKILVTPTESVEIGTFGIKTYSDLITVTYNK